MTRRGFLVTGAGVAAGAVAASLPGGRNATHGTAAAASTAGAAPADPGVRALADGAVVHVQDASRGELVVMGDGFEVAVTDHALVAALGRALHGRNGG